MDATALVAVAGVLFLVLPVVVMAVLGYRALRDGRGFEAEITTPSGTFRLRTEADNQERTSSPDRSQR
jgi:hypothetical protein